MMVSNLSDLFSAGDCFAALLLLLLGVTMTSMIRQFVMSSPKYAAHCAKYVQLDESMVKTTVMMEQASACRKSSCGCGCWLLLLHWGWINVIERYLAKKQSRDEVRK